MYGLNDYFHDEQAELASHIFWKRFFGITLLLENIALVVYWIMG